MTRIWVGLLGCASLVAAAGLADAQGKPAKGHDKAASQQPNGGGKAKHQHHDHNAHALLGAKLKQDGKHAVGKFKTRDVVADVKGGKVVAMAAGDLPAKRVRSKTKMAVGPGGPGGLIRAAWPGLQLAQYDSYSYGYCFDDGVDFDCYWYPPEDVAYEGYTWEDYDPYY